MRITKAEVQKFLDVCSIGLSSGLGSPEPGKMCVEAALCYALGLPHSDDPECVEESIRSLKISLNDKKWSSKERRGEGMRRLGVIQIGSKGKVDGAEFARRVSETCIRKYVPLALRSAARVHPKQKHREAMEAAAKRCEAEGTRVAAKDARNVAVVAAAAAAADYAAAANAAAAAAAAAADAAAVAAAANAAYAASYAASYAAANASAAASYAACYAAAAARDSILAAFAEDCVQILVSMKAPGAKWLELAGPAPDWAKLP